MEDNHYNTMSCGLISLCCNTSHAYIMFGLGFMFCIKIQIFFYYHLKIAENANSMYVYSSWQFHTACTISVYTKPQSHPS